MVEPPLTVLLLRLVHYITNQKVVSCKMDLFFLVTMHVSIRHFWQHHFQRWILSHAMITISIIHRYVSGLFQTKQFFVTHDNCFDANFLILLCICVECPFGMLVQRWGILKSSLSCHFSIAKITALVSALVKLHNHCIECSKNVPFSQQIDALEDLRPDIQRSAFSWSGYVKLERDPATNKLFYSN